MSFSTSNAPKDLTSTNILLIIFGYSIWVRGRNEVSHRLPGIRLLRNEAQVVDMDGSSDVSASGKNRSAEEDRSPHQMPSSSYSVAKIAKGDIDMLLNLSKPLSTLLLSSTTVWLFQSNQSTCVWFESPL